MTRNRLLVAALALILAGPAAAQVRQSGNVTPGHVATWTTTGVIQDAGTSATPAVTTLGLMASGQTPLCIDNGPITGGYSAFCLGVTATGAYVTLQNFGGGAALPLYFDINGTVTSFASLLNGTTISNDLILSNISGTTAPATGNTMPALLDATLGATPGDTLWRAPAGWKVLGPGANGSCLTYSTSGPAVGWGSCAGTGGTGTVTSITFTNGLTATENPAVDISTAGLATIANNTVLGNTTGSSAVPSSTGVSALIDSALGNTRGSVLERGSAGWTPLTPGSANTALVSNGSGADPSYTTLTALLDAAIGSTRGSILERGSAGWALLAPGATAGTVLTSAGSGADPTYTAQSGFSGVNVQEFATSGTYTPTTGMKYAIVYAWGGGGGSTAIANAASNGAATTLGALVSAPGGAGASATTGGAGGSGGTGTILIAGQAGGAGTCFTDGGAQVNCTGGAGGGSPMMAPSIPNTVAAASIAGTLPGQGAAGAESVASPGGSGGGGGGGGLAIAAVTAAAVGASQTVTIGGGGSGGASGGADGYKGYLYIVEYK